MSVLPASLQGVHGLRKFHGVMALAWTILIVPTLLWWHDSVLWVAVMSLYANIASEMAAWQASRVETRQEAMEKANSSGTSSERSPGSATLVGTDPSPPEEPAMTGPAFQSAGAAPADVEVPPQARRPGREPRAPVEPNRGTCLLCDQPIAKQPESKDWIHVDTVSYLCADRKNRAVLATPTAQDHAREGEVIAQLFADAELAADVRPTRDGRGVVRLSFETARELVEVYLGEYDDGDAGADT